MTETQNPDPANVPVDPVVPPSEEQEHEQEEGERYDGGEIPQVDPSTENDEG